MKEDACKEQGIKPEESGRVLTDEDVKAIAAEVVKQITPLIRSALGAKPERVSHVLDAKRIMELHLEAQNDIARSREKQAREKAVGARLRDARVKENLSLAQLSDMTGIPEDHISRMEEGLRLIAGGNANRLAKARKLDPNDIRTR